MERSNFGVLDMQRKYVVFLALFLCSLAFSMLTVEPVLASVALVILLAGVVIGALATYIIDRYMTSTVFQYGATLDSYATNIVTTTQESVDIIDATAKNLDSLVNGVKLVWFRKAEYTSQCYLSNTTYPSETIADSSTVKAEYVNCTVASLLGFDRLLAKQNTYITGVVPTFTYLDVYGMSTVNENASIKGGSNLTLGYYYYNAGTSTGNNTVGYFYYSDAVYDELSSVQNKICSSISAASYKLYLDHYTDQHVKDSSILLVSSSTTQQWNDINCIESGYYVLLICPNTGGYNTEVFVPICFAPVNVTTSYDTFEFSVAKNPGNSSGSMTRLQALSYRHTNGTVFGDIVFSAMLSDLATFVNAYTQAKVDALGSGQTYWNFLRGMGYADIDDIPSSFYIPPPSVAVPNFADMGTLTIDQQQALYYAWLNNLENFFNSTSYESANMTATETIVGNLSLTVKCSVVNASDEVVFSDKIVFIQPSVQSFTITKNEQYVLNQSVFCVYSVSSSSGGYIWQTLTIPSGYKINVTEIYLNGVLTNDTIATFAMTSLSQAAYEFDFDIQGESTTGTTDISAWLYVLIPVMMIAMIVPALFSRRRN